MTPVEIEQAISDLAEAPFDAVEFPYAFLEPFGCKATKIKKPREGDKKVGPWRSFAAQQHSYGELRAG